MPHGHGGPGRGGEGHYCHCPTCDYVTEVEEGEQCSLLPCPRCGRGLYSGMGDMVTLPQVQKHYTIRN